MMNYSDYDSDGYSSNEDADYVPSDDNLSEDDINECEREEPLDENDEVARPGDASKRKKKMKGKDVGMRKRMKGCLKLEGEEEGKGGGGAEEKKEEEAQEEESGRPVGRDDDKQKKKADDLWASFLSDVGSRPTPSAAVTQSSTTQQAVCQSDSLESESSPASTEVKPSEPTKPTEPSTVTITKVFDFAGEEVRVTKEVSADSKEAKSFLKSQEEEMTEQPSKPLLPGPSAKRPVGMSSVLGRLGGKKQKMSTLEKSKMDWDAFKSEQGITEELAIHNRGKEGYVERKNFLERVDHRQFELEKAVRLTNMKPR